MRALRGTGDGTPSRRALREVAGGFINHPGQLAHSEASAAAGRGRGRNRRKDHQKGPVPITTPVALSEAGTFASAASGGKSEQKGVAAAKIL